MSHALQVSFRRVLPNEALVALAARRARHIHRARPDALECCVVVETVESKHAMLIQAVVTLRGESTSLVESMALHRNAGTALGLAFASAEARLGVFPQLEDAAFAPIPEPRVLRAASSR